MEVGPPKAAGRSRLQTTLRCVESNGYVLNVREKVLERKSQVIIEESNSCEPSGDVPKLTIIDIKTGGLNLSSGRAMAGDLLTGHRISGI
jgi:hypothetical protein